MEKIWIVIENYNCDGDSVIEYYPCLTKEDAQCKFKQCVENVNNSDNIFKNYKNIEIENFTVTEDDDLFMINHKFEWYDVIIEIKEKEIHKKEKNIMENVTFKNCLFNNGAINQSQLSNVIFENCKFNNVLLNDEVEQNGLDLIQIKTLDGDVVFEGRFATFTECFLNAVGNGIDMEGVDFRDKNFDNFYLSGANLNNCDFTNSTFNSCNLEKINFANSILTNVSFNDSYCTDCNFQDTERKGIKFNNTYVHLTVD